MADQSPLKEFGRRKPATPALPAQPVKRSNRVALLLMGTVAVGGTAYLLLPNRDCKQDEPGVTSSADPQQEARCRSGSSSHGSSGSRYYSGGDSSSSSGTSHTTSTGISRGGFGSMGHVFGFSGG